MEGLWKCIFAHKKTAPCELEGMSNFWGAVQVSDDLFSHKSTIILWLGCNYFF